MRRREVPPPRLETFLSADARIEGKLTSRSGIRVDGTVRGEIAVEGDCVIGESADVEANIRGAHVTIAGRVKGDVVARERLSLLQGAHLIGNIRVKSLVVEAGAIFQGSSSMLEKPEEHPAEDPLFDRQLDDLLASSPRIDRKTRGDATR